MFLLDTNVVSAARKRDPFVSRWIAGQEPHSLWLSVVTLGEIARGIEMKRRHDPAAARHLSNWLARIQLDYTNRIFDIDRRIAAEWGVLDAKRTRNTADGLIAATAIVHGCAVVTRNVADFADLDLDVIDPWTSIG
jgi:predicted nucleic acid-binding protein